MLINKEEPRLFLQRAAASKYVYSVRSYIYTSPDEGGAGCYFGCSRDPNGRMWGFPGSRMIEALEHRQKVPPRPGRPEKKRAASRDFGAKNDLQQGRYDCAVSDALQTSYGVAPDILYDIISVTPCLRKCPYGFAFAPKLPQQGK